MAHQAGHAGHTMIKLAADAPCLIPRLRLCGSVLMNTRHITGEPTSPPFQTPSSRHNGSTDAADF